MTTWAWRDTVVDFQPVDNYTWTYHYSWPANGAQSFQRYIQRSTWTVTGRGTTSGTSSDIVPVILRLAGNVVLEDDSGIIRHYFTAAASLQPTLYQVSFDTGGVYSMQWTCGYDLLAFDSDTRHQGSAANNMRITAAGNLHIPGTPNFWEIRPDTVQGGIYAHVLVASQ